MPLKVSKPLSLSSNGSLQLPLSLPSWFLRMLLIYLKFGAIHYILRFFDWPMGICFSKMIFEYLLFISFSNVNHLFISVHKIWIYLLNHYLFTFSSVLRMLGWLYESNFKMRYDVLPAVLLTSSFLWWQLPHNWSRLCICLCAVCNICVVFMVLGLSWLVITDWGLVGRAWPTQLFTKLFWNNLRFIEMLKRYYREFPYTTHPVSPLLTSYMSVVHFSKLRNWHWY